jgi:YhcG PDDEXK nuclease domain
MIASRLHLREGAAPSNFPGRLPAGDSELAQQMTRDPVLFDFLDLGGQLSEREVEQALMDRLTETLLALGHGFAFVGRQVHLDVGDEDFYVDLLFFLIRSSGGGVMHVRDLRRVDAVPPSLTSMLCVSTTRGGSCGASAVDGFTRLGPALLHGPRRTAPACRADRDVSLPPRRPGLLAEHRQGVRARPSGLLRLADIRA